MTWVVRTGIPKDPRDRPHYLAAWDDGVSTTDPKRQEWEDTQLMAHRFSDRNEALRVARSFPICAYDDDVRPVRLVPKFVTPPPIAILNETVGKAKQGGEGWDGDCG